MTEFRDPQSRAPLPPTPLRARAALAKAQQHRWLVGGAALSLLLVGYWHFAGAGSAPDRAGHNAAPVRVAKVERRDLAVVEHTIGTLVATATVQVTARVQGTLDKAYFQEGQFVKKGALLFQIDPRPYAAALAQAQATLRRDEALLRNANRDKQRYQTLFAANAVSSQQRDTANANADALAATVAMDKATLDAAALNLGYTQIRSPIDGKTGPLLVQPGNMIAAGGSAALVTIAQLRPIKLSFNLPQADLPRVETRLKTHTLLVEIDRPGLRPLTAPVDFMSNAVSSEAGTIELRASFDNVDQSLLPGETVNVTVQLDSIDHALVVPHDALNDGPNRTYVYTVVQGHAEPRSVRILFDDSQNAAVTGKIRPGDEVVVEGQLRVVPGGPVKIFPPAHVHLNANDMNAQPDNGDGGQP